MQGGNMRLVGWIRYNSCRNRHCPKCQGHKKEVWIRAREAKLLNASYFHVVFTLPSELNQLCLYKPRLVYDFLFKTAWSIIQDFGKNPKFLGAKMGMIAINSSTCIKPRVAEGYSYTF